MNKSSILLLALAIGVTPAIAQNTTYRHRNHNSGYYNGQNGTYNNGQNNGYYNGQNGTYNNGQNNGYYNGQNGTYNNGQNNGYYNGQNGTYNNNGYYRNGNNPGYDTPGERNLPDRVDIIGSPRVDVGRNGARIYWQTNNVAATDVWLVGGGINGHRAGYQRGGSRDHMVTFDNLRPNRTYTYLIRSNRGEVRYQGNFTTR